MRLMLDRAELMDIFASLFILSGNRRPFEYYPHAPLREAYTRLERFFLSNRGMLEPYLGITPSGLFVPEAIYSTNHERDFTFSDLLASYNDKTPLQNYQLLLQQYLSESTIGDFTMKRIENDANFLKILINNNKLRGTTASNLLAWQACTPVLNLYMTTFYFEYVKAVEEEAFLIKHLFIDEYERIRRLFTRCDSNDEVLRALPEGYEAELQGDLRYYCISPLMPYSYFIVHLSDGDLLCVGLFFDSEDINPSYRLSRKRPFEFT